MSQELRIIPIGGLGEFGMNALALESGDDVILIDAGSLFPGPDGHGIDVIVPDFAYLEAKRDKLRGLVLTHAHLDHIGAVPHLLAKLDVPIYGTAFTLGLVRKQVSEFTLLRPPNLTTVQPGESFSLGCFEIEGIHVTHSTVQCMALAISTPKGYVIHTGDFKIDQTPIDGRKFDFAKFADYGQRGVLLLLADSTNADVPGFSNSEQDVGLAMDHLFAHSEHALFFSCFSSAIHRVQQIVDRAVSYRRKLAFVGRSLASACDIATDLGQLKVPPGTLVKPQELETHPRRDRVAIVAGSQGEPLSSLSRASVGRHPAAVIEDGDTVAISAKMIPGNEKPILRMVDQLYRRGARVHYGDTLRNLHVSGHPCREELKLLLNLVRPRYFVPIHGDYRQLEQHRRLAMEVRAGDLEDAFVLENGCVLQFDADGVRVLPDKVPVGHALIDSGTGDHIVRESVMQDRRDLSKSGVLLPVITIDERRSQVAEIEMISRGFVVSEESQSMLDGAAHVIRETVSSSTKVEIGNVGLMEEKIRDDVRRYVSRKTKRQSHPLIVPIILEG